MNLHLLSFENYAIEEWHSVCKTAISDTSSKAFAFILSLCRISMAQVAFPVHLPFYFPFFFFLVMFFIVVPSSPKQVLFLWMLHQLSFIVLIFASNIVNYILLIWRSLWQLNDSVLRIVSGNIVLRLNQSSQNVWVTTEDWKFRESFGTRLGFSSQCSDICLNESFFQTNVFTPKEWGIVMDMYFLKECIIRCLLMLVSYKVIY